jgi:hypothetical protein
LLCFAMLWVHSYVCVYRSTSQLLQNQW